MFFITILSISPSVTRHKFECIFEMFVCKEFFKFFGAHQVIIGKYLLYTHAVIDCLFFISEVGNDKKILKSFFRYKKSSRYGNVGYEEDFLRYLQNIMSDVERRIRRGHMRLTVPSVSEKVVIKNLHFH